jgi:hypothetical protein
VRKVFKDDLDMIKTLKTFPPGTKAWVEIPDLEIGYTLRIDERGMLD